VKLLVTRPSQQASATVSKLALRGHNCLLDPLLEIVPIKTQMPNNKTGRQSWNALLVTSTNATPALVQNFQANIPILTTGEATKNSLVGAGFENVTSANGSALELSAKVRPWMQGQGLDEQAELLYPSAAETAHDLTSVLADQGVRCITWPVYEARDKTKFSQEVKNAFTNESLDGVLLYSPRTARCFNQLFENLTNVKHNFDIFVLSSAIANELNDDLRQTTRIAAKPNETFLLELIDHYLR